MEISQYSQELFFLVVLVDVLHPSSHQLGSSRFISGCRRPIQLSVMCVYVVFFFFRVCLFLSSKFLPDKVFQSLCFFLCLIPLCHSFASFSCKSFP